MYSGATKMEIGFGGHGFHAVQDEVRSGLPTAAIRDYAVLESRIRVFLLARFKTLEVTLSDTGYSPVAIREV